MKKLLLLAALASMSGCATEAVQKAGDALDNSWRLVRPMAELGIAARSASSDQTIAEFLNTQGVSALGESEDVILTATLDEHEQTIYELQNFGGE